VNVPAATTPSGVGGGGSGSGVGRIPDLTLECFQDGGRVRLTELRRPVILNLWASWCAPCRTELPTLQRFARTAGDQVTVLGVDTGDTRDAGASVLQDTKISYPNLYDERRQLLVAVGRGALPVTLFVTADGTVRYLYNSTALDDVTLARLARTHLGVG
jgi:thiol-disulfide isomerase/thioredoxin